ncbi:MAG: hypothetical protein ACP5RT_01525 [Candidatus Micrarchaeia archaeon]
MYYGLMFSFAMFFSILFLSMITVLLGYYNKITISYYELGYATSLETFGVMAQHENLSYVFYAATLDGFSSSNNIIYYGNSYIKISK